MGELSQIWRLGACLLITYVPCGPSLTVSTPCCAAGTGERAREAIKLQKILERTPRGEGCIRLSQGPHRILDVAALDVYVLHVRLRMRTRRGRWSGLTAMGVGSHTSAAAQHAHLQGLVQPVDELVRQLVERVLVQRVRGVAAARSGGGAAAAAAGIRTCGPMSRDDTVGAPSSTAFPGAPAQPSVRRPGRDMPQGGGGGPATVRRPVLQAHCC